MRYALRNQAKIEERLGSSALSRIKKGLKRYFETEANPELYFKTIPGLPYQVLTIPDITDGKTDIRLYFIRKKWDVLTFAFKEFIKNESSSNTK